MISTFNGLSRELRRRVMLMVGRAVLTAVNDSTGLQTVQVEGLRGEVIDGAERMQLYGITSHPLKGADVLVLSVGGVRQHPVVLIDDRRHRVADLEEGEVCIYTHEDDPDNNDLHRVILKEGRVAEIRCGGSSIVMDTDGITLTAGNGSTIAMGSNLDLNGGRIDLN